MIYAHPLHAPRILVTGNAFCSNHCSSTPPPSPLQKSIAVPAAVAAVFFIAATAANFHNIPSACYQLSDFRLGLDYRFERFCTLPSKCLELFLVPDTPLPKSVVL